MEVILFYTFSGLAILSAFMVISASKPTRALLSLIVTMFSLTILYLLLNAPFVAMVNLIVYAGAVLVLFLFVIMLQGVGAKSIPLINRFNKGHLLLVFIAIICFAGTIFAVALSVGAGSPSPEGAAGTAPLQVKGVIGSAEAIGRKMFIEYLLPFELISVLLLVGVFAAVSLAKKDEEVKK